MRTALITCAAAFLLGSTAQQKTYSYLAPAPVEKPEAVVEMEYEINKRDFYFQQQASNSILADQSKGLDGLQYQSIAIKYALASLRSDTLIQDYAEQPEVIHYNRKLQAAQHQEQEALLAATASGMFALSLPFGLVSLRGKWSEDDSLYGK